MHPPLRHSWLQLSSEGLLVQETQQASGSQKLAEVQAQLKKAKQETVEAKLLTDKLQTELNAVTNKQVGIVAGITHRDRHST